MASREYSATATPDSVGHRACVRVVKTKDWFNKLAEKHRALEKERDLLGKMVMRD